MFENLVNDRGLVPMKITTGFAPYQEGSIAGFFPDTAEKIHKLGYGHPVSQDGEPVQVRKAPPPPQDPVQHAVEIPDDWRGLHHLKRISLAKALKGTDVSMTVPEADAVIEAVQQVRSTDHNG